MKNIFYILLLLVIALSSCNKSEQDELTVQVYIPNAFRPASKVSDCPDGDLNCNNVFRVVVNPNGLSYSGHLLVLDSKGKTIFETFSLKEGWNGTVRNKGEKECAQGHYSYILKITELPGERSRIFEGDVILLR